MTAIPEPSLYCSAITKDGRKCPAFRAGLSDFCAAHNPESRHAAATARKRKGLPKRITDLETERTKVIERIAKLEGRLVAIDELLVRLRSWHGDTPGPVEGEPTTADGDHADHREPGAVLVPSTTKYGGQ